MLEIILTDQQGGRVVLPEGSAYEYNEATMQVTVINPQTGARLQLAGLLGETVQVEYPDPYWVSNPELALTPPADPTTRIALVLTELPVHALAELFDCTVQKPYDQGGDLPKSAVAALFKGEQPAGPSHLELVNQLAKVIPGMNAPVLLPCDCKLLDIELVEQGGLPVRKVVVHLNDKHGWTYQQIADWLDSLDVDLTVHEPPAEGKELALTNAYDEDADEGVVMQTYTFDKPISGSTTSIETFQGKTIGVTHCPVIPKFHDELKPNEKED